MKHNHSQATALSEPKSSEILGPRSPVDRTAALRQARLRARLGAPVKAFLEPELRRRLDQFAASRQMTIADVLREALQSYLDQQKVAAKSSGRTRLRVAG